METFSALLALCAGNSPRWIPLTNDSDAELWGFLWLRLKKKRLSKQSWGWWFETHCAHYDVTVMIARLSHRCMQLKIARFISARYFEDLYSFYCQTRPSLISLAINICTFPSTVAHLIPPVRFLCYWCLITRHGKTVHIHGQQQGGDIRYDMHNMYISSGEGIHNMEV